MKAAYVWMGKAGKAATDEKKDDLDVIAEARLVYGELQECFTANDGMFSATAVERVTVAIHILGSSQRATSGEQGPRHQLGWAHV